MKKRLRKSIGLAFLILLLALIQPDTILAGEGVYEAGDPDKLTLNVLFQFDSSANFNPNPEWEAVFNKASQLLYNSTDGQLQIGTINFYNNCEQVTPQMDVLIQSGAGGASAHVEGMGVTGLHIFVYQDTHSQDVPAARGHFGVVHELGHYLFGMYDSYIDRNNNPTSCINATSTVATIMDGGTTVQPKNARTEWTLPKDESSCRNTAQYQIRGMVDWPWIVSYVNQTYGASLTQPSDYDTSAPAGHQALTFNYFDCGLRTVICADASGSMAGEKIETLRSGASIFVDLSAPADQLGVVAFDSSPSTVFSIAKMEAANQSAAKAAIASLRDGSRTDIGAGLQASLDMITGQGKPLSNEVIILLSDGLHNGAVNPLSVTPAIGQRGIRIYTIGLGGDADANLLSSIARETGGTYYFAPDASVLTAHFNSIFTQLRNDGALVKQSEMIVAGEQQIVSVDLDRYTAQAGEATFALNWGAGDLDLRIQRPDGSPVNPGDPDVALYIDQNQSQIYRLSNPSAGQWQVSIQAASTDTRYTLQVSSVAESQVSLVTTTDRPNYNTGEPIFVQASVTAPASTTGQVSPVVLVNVAADVYRHGVLLETITLMDNGDLALGDLRSQDGVYSAAFYPLENGNYTFIVKARNENGQTAPPDEEYPGFVAVPVDPFTRMAETTVYVEGAAVAPVITATPLPTATPAAAPPAPPPTPAGGLGLGFVFVLLALGGLGVYIATRRRLAGQGVVGTAARLLLPDGQVIQLVDNFVIGRSSLANLHLHDQAVSRRHAILRFSQGGWFVQDQGSSAGTFVNGQPVQAARLYPGDRIQIGSTTVVFQV